MGILFQIRHIFILHVRAFKKTVDYFGSFSISRTVTIHFRLKGKNNFPNSIECKYISYCLTCFFFLYDLFFFIAIGILCKYFVAI